MQDVVMLLSDENQYDINEKTQWLSPSHLPISISTIYVVDINIVHQMEQRQGTHFWMVSHL